MFEKIALNNVLVRERKRKEKANNNDDEGGGSSGRRDMTVGLANLSNNPTKSLYYLSYLPKSPQIISQKPIINNYS